MRVAAASLAIVLASASVTVAVLDPGSGSNGGSAAASAAAPRVVPTVALTSAATGASPSATPDLAESAANDVASARDFILEQRADAAAGTGSEALADDVRLTRQEVAERATRDAERAELARATPKELGQRLAAETGWTGSQWTCLDSLWTRESNWNPAARNRSSGAFGIPQALPGGKMASAGADWATNPATQIAWGLGYIRDVYGTPCGAWSHSQGYGWY